ncbi:cytochrome P450 [Streptomyces chartreusis]|uniref:Cytochrome P450 n=1 Tax=Streptomyces chartreusis TaxID=1969 RepID=A0A7H8TBL2_STRCX|nr:cytochrome P450 [Streptomyces chartreusis]QKZ20846.1 cytochrome P450 [Streptomyces chartreusis]
MTTEAPAVDLLPFRDPDYRANPAPYYARLRREAPVYRHPVGVYVVSRYADVAKLIRNPTLSVRKLDFGVADPLHHTVLGQDAPDHTRLRRITNRWFTPKAVEGWAKVMQASVDTVLDEVAEGDGVLDAVNDLALRSTFQTICHIFGIAPTRMLEIQQATYDIGLSLGPGSDEDDWRITGAAFEWYDEHVRGLITHKRAHPGGGLIDHFLDEQDAGNMSEEEVIYSTLLFFAVGHLDIKHLIVQGIRHLAEHPEYIGIYRDQPEARPGFINEILRIETPEQMVSRLTTQDTVIGDTTVPAGEVLILLIGSANRDPDAFPDPDGFDHTRPAGATSQHLAFGSGQHGCAGQVLARAQADVVFTTLVNRFHTIELAGEPTFAHTEFLRSISHLPIRLG